jgi:release factor glutamine methyltransferase
VKSNLKQLYKIQRVLESNGYFDVSRIAREIQEYCEKNSVSPTKILKRIENDEPWEYIKGYTEFHGLKFAADENTLIPRVETEQMVDIAVDILSDSDEYKYVLDVGTGSGCIIIFLAKNLCKRNNIKFLATDINSQALQVAKKNSVLHNVNKKTTFLKSNLLKGVDIDNSSFIIANLPYIPSYMLKNLDKSVVNFEPRNALDGGKDGLIYYKKLLKQIEEKGLREYKTTVLIEIEPSTLSRFKRFLKEYDNTLAIKVFKDFRGKDRFVLIHLS